MLDTTLTLIILAAVLASTRILYLTMGRARARRPAPTPVRIDERRARHPDAAVPQDVTSWRAICPHLEHPELRRR